MQYHQLLNVKVSTLKLDLKICVKSININSCELVIPFHSVFFLFYKTTTGCDLNVTTLIEGCGLVTIYEKPGISFSELTWNVLQGNQKIRNLDSVSCLESEKWLSSFILILKFDMNCFLTAWILNTFFWRQGRIKTFWFNIFSFLRIIS